jgi:hypothetical protein
MVIELIDGSLGGGNTAILLRIINNILQDYGLKINKTSLLNSQFDYSLFERLRIADAWVIGTGTYWDSWGSPLQQWLEWITPWEGSSDILGKPVGIVISAHSVGAKGILSRLQGVLSCMGLLIPPMSGMVITMASETALEITTGTWKQHELWGREDLEIIIHNTLSATKISKDLWRTWPTGGDESCSNIWMR